MNNKGKGMSEKFNSGGGGQKKLNLGRGTAWYEERKNWNSMRRECRRLEFRGHWGQVSGEIEFGGGMSQDKLNAGGEGWGQNCFRCNPPLFKSPI